MWLFRVYNELNTVVKRQRVIETKVLVFLFITLTPFVKCSLGFTAGFSDIPVVDRENTTSRESLPGEDRPADLTEDDILGIPWESVSPSSSGFIWESDISISLGAGYKKNVLYSSNFKENNPFLRAQADIMLFGLSSDDEVLTGYLDIENNHYFSLKEGDDENIVMTYLEWQKYLNQTVQLGVSGSYSYFHLFFDTSLSDLEQDTSVLKEHIFEFSPYLKKQWSEKWTTDGHLRLIRNVYDDSIDNSTEFESGLGIAFEYGYASKVRFSYIWNRNDYDDRNVKTPEGDDVAGKNLLRKSHQIKLKSKHAWDAHKVWTSQTDVSVEICEDNYEGYDDYNRLKAAEKISFQKGKWTVALGMALSRYDVGNRKMPEDNIDYITTTGTFEVRNAFDPHWTVFLETEHEMQHYEEFEDYRITTILLGIQWQK